MSLHELLLIANSLVSTTYGYAEKNCGDIGRPRPCEFGAITASGEVFDPSLPSAAIAAPTHVPLAPTWIWLRSHKTRTCHKIRLNDKSNPRWIGKRGFDLSPAAVALITGKPATPYWSDNLVICKAEGVRDPKWDNVPTYKRILANLFVLHL